MIHHYLRNKLNVTIPQYRPLKSERFLRTLLRKSVATLKKYAEMVVYLGLETAGINGISNIRESLLRILKAKGGLNCFTRWGPLFSGCGPPGI